MSSSDRIATTLEAHPITAALGAVGVLAVAGLAFQIIRFARRRGLTGEQAGTLLAAAIATGVSAQGMWVFFDKSLHLTLSLRIMFFAFLEIMVLTSALRARSAQQVTGSAGIDGVAMWVLTCLSAVLAATDADNVGTVLIRLSAPLVAAWGWERSMALERRRSGTLGGINWRITPERILIRLGIADPTSRTAGEVALQRRLIDVALAADRARTLRETGAGTRRVNRARRRLQRVMRRAVEDGGLVDDTRTPRSVLMDNLRILSSTGALLEVDLPNPWTIEESPDPHTAPEPRAPQAGSPTDVIDGSPDTIAQIRQLPAASAESPVQPSAPVQPQGQPSAPAGAHAQPPASAEPHPRPSASAESHPRPSASAESHAQPSTAAESRTQPSASEIEYSEYPTRVDLPIQRPESAAQPRIASDRSNQAAAEWTPSAAEMHDQREPQEQRATRPASAPLSAVAAQGSAAFSPAGEDHSETQETLPRTSTETTTTSSTLRVTADPRARRMSSNTIRPRPTPPPATSSSPSSPPPAANQATTAPAQTDSTRTTEPPESPAASATPTQTDSAAPAQPGRQLRRDPAIRDRVRELRETGIPTSEIATQLGTSPRTISRILGDLDAESTATQQLAIRQIPERNLAQTAVSGWRNGFHVLSGENVSPTNGSRKAASATEELPTDRASEN
ncbi:hypothetical protein [Nocardia alni]|uniref:hypothetical protein n=1 Tax=Nocardia alni TaxID=2815723 RepID=UPI001C239D4B|nr:hypothetical protein [Nocardia alni]